MIIFKTAHLLSEFISIHRRSGKKAGFIPTMGALHPGHLSLLHEARSHRDFTICSIFVNPTQFHNQDDFNKYPNTTERDIQLLHDAGCSLLFLPDVTEIYPSGYEKKRYPLGEIETILEGHYRPGHFQGVCEVVDRLLDIIQPQAIYMGRKDYQQCIVVSKLLSITGRKEHVQMIICPTVREADGLAMSSRNLRLDAEQRKEAPAIYKALRGIKEELGKHPVEHVRQQARAYLESHGFRVDYVEIANAELLPANNKTESQVALIAASLGDIRLIDNLTLN